VTVLVRWEGLELYWRRSPGQVGLPERIRGGAEAQYSWPSWECALLSSYVAMQSWKGAGTPVMIPDNQKQLNIAFPKLTAGYVTRRDTEHCVWINQLYSGAAKLPQR
jgi:hypothetical protein